MTDKIDVLIRVLKEHMLDLMDEMASEILLGFKVSQTDCYKDLRDKIDSVRLDLAELESKDKGE